jgi:hypothetical protein
MEPTESFKLSPELVRSLKIRDGSRDVRVAKRQEIFQKLVEDFKLSGHQPNDLITIEQYVEVLPEDCLMFL